MQEDLYEIHQRYMRECQRVRSDLFKKTAVWTAKFGFFPPMAWQQSLIQFSLVAEAEREEQQMVKILPFRKRMGPLDWVQYYDAPGANDLRHALFLFTQGLGLAQNLSIPSLYPGHEYLLLTRTADPEDIPTNWKVVITGETRRIAANRLGLDRVQ